MKKHLNFHLIKEAISLTYDMSRCLINYIMSFIVLFYFLKGLGVNYTLTDFKELMTYFIPIYFTIKFIMFIIKTIMQIFKRGDLN